MALQTSLTSLQRRGKKPARRHEEKAEVRDKAQDMNTGTQPQWVEGGPSFLDGIRATLATLTEEEKEAFHLSLQSQGQGQG